MQPWLAWVSAVLVGVLVARWSYLGRTANNRRFTHQIGAALIVLAWHSDVWSRFSQGYPGDTIYNLSIPGRIGLIALTGSVMLLLMYFSQVKSRWLYRLPINHTSGPVLVLALDLVVTTLLFAALLAIAPQLYYTYYHLLFDLEQQWVIKPFSLSKVWQLLQVVPQTSLAKQTTGLFLWWLLVLVVLDGLKNARAADRTLVVTVVAMSASIAWHYLLH